MAVHLLGRLKDQFSADLVTRVASAIGEGEAATRKAIDGALPAILDMLAVRASGNGAGALVELLRERGLDGSRLGSAAQRLSSREATAELRRIGEPMLGHLFGTQREPAIDQLASRAGIGRAAAAALMGLLSPLVVDFVAKAAAWSGGFEPQALAALLAEQSRFSRQSSHAGAGGATRWTV